MSTTSIFSDMHTSLSRFITHGGIIKSVAIFSKLLLPHKKTAHAGVMYSATLYRLMRKIVYLKCV